MIHHFLSFALQETMYAVEVNQVKGVLEYTQPVRLPCTKEYVEGLIDSRGEGVAVINLRRKFGLSEAAPDKNTRIIVAEITQENGNSSEDKKITVFGAVADSVKEVVDIDDSDIDETPKFGNSIAEEYIKGIGKYGEEFLVILNLDKVYSSEDIAEAAVPETSAAQNIQAC